MPPVKDSVDVSPLEVAEIAEETVPNERFENIVKALKVINDKFEINEAELNRLKDELELKHYGLGYELVEKRRKILSGEYEPTANDLEHIVDDETNKFRQQYVEGLKSQPKFWLTVLKKAVGAVIYGHDEPILTHLKDLNMKLHDSPMGYTLVFEFSENEYFTNTVLTKYYERDSHTKYQGTKINWNKNKNVTLKYEEKKIKGFKTLDIKPVASFFNIFDPPPSRLTQNRDTEAANKSNYRIFQQIIHFGLPQAVHFFTKEKRSNYYQIVGNVSDETEKMDTDSVVD